ncbi:TPA: hypothetical protein ACG5WY_004811 [Escherichia coli]
MASLILAVCGAKDVVDLNRLIYLLLTIQLNRLTAFLVPLLPNPQLLVGWDTPLSRFFLVIEPELDEPVYSNIYEKDPSSLTLEFFQSVLERYGIENVSLLPGHESGLYEKLHDDRRNNN